MTTTLTVAVRSIGRVTYQKTCSSVAPSTRAASRAASGMLRMPARNSAIT